MVNLIIKHIFVSTSEPKDPWDPRSKGVPGIRDPRESLGDRIQGSPWDLEYKEFPGTQDPKEPPIPTPPHPKITEKKKSKSMGF